MPKQYEENFAEMDAEEKENFLCRFGCLSLESDFVNDLFALTAYTRGLNTLERVQELPEVLRIANGLLWDAMATGETVVTEELSEFQGCYQAAVCMMSHLDASYLDTPEKEAFYQTYFAGRNADEAFLLQHAHLFFDIVSGTGESPDRVGELLEHPVETLAEECFTSLKRDKPGYSSSELEEHSTIVHASPVFCGVIARLQEDMRAVISGMSVEQLRERCESLCLFSEEEIVQMIQR